MFFDVQAYNQVWESAIDMENAPESQLGRGIHRLEVWPPAIRWTERHSMFRLRRIHSHQRALIRFYSGPKELHHPLTGRISAGTSSATFWVEPDEWTTISVEVPQNTDTNIVEVELDLDWSWLPSEIHGGSDTRNLGVAVRRVWLE